MLRIWGSLTLAGLITALAMTMASASGAPIGETSAGGMICSPVPSARRMASAVEVKTYPVQGTSVDDVVEVLTSREKPYAARAYGQVGWFDYSWTSRVSSDASGHVRSACVSVNYKIHYPEVRDPAMKQCFAGLVKKVVAHEQRHLEITDEVIRQKLDRLVGMPTAKARQELARLDAEIERANKKFHHRPEGRILGPRHFPGDKCGENSALGA